MIKNKDPLKEKQRGFEGVAGRQGNLQVVLWKES